MTSKTDTASVSQIVEAVMSSDPEQQKWIGSLGACGMETAIQYIRQLALVVPGLGPVGALEIVRKLHEGGFIEID